MAIDFRLSDEEPVESEADNSPLELVEPLLSAICDEFALSDDGYASSKDFWRCTCLNPKQRAVLYLQKSRKPQEELLVVL